MAGNVATVKATLRLDTSEARASLRRDMSRAGQDSGQEFGSKFRPGIKDLGSGLLPALGVAAAVGGFTKILKASSDYNEEASKARTIFGSNSQAVMAWSKNSAQAFGLSQRAALSGVASFGNFFAQIGIGSKESLKMSERLVQLSSDFASFQNADPASVMDAMLSATRGEYDALQKFVPTVSAATVQTRAMADAHVSSAEALTNAQKATALYNLVLEGSGAANGDFLRTSGGLANQQRILAGNLEDTAKAAGDTFKPAMVGALQAVNSVGVGTVALGAAGLVLGRMIGGAGGSFTAFSASVRQTAASTMVAGEAAAGYNAVLARVAAGGRVATAGQIALAESYLMAGTAAATSAAGQRGFSGIIGRTGGQIQNATTGLGRMGAAARGAGSLVKGAGTAILGAFGGPVGLAIVAAAVGIGYFAKRSADAKAAAVSLQGSLSSYAQVFSNGITPAALESAKALLVQDKALSGVVAATLTAGVSSDTLIKGLNGDAKARDEVVTKIDTQIALLGRVHDAEVDQLKVDYAGQTEQKATRVGAANEAYEKQVDVLTKQRIAFYKTSAAQAEAGALTDAVSASNVVSVSAFGSALDSTQAKLVAGAAIAETASDRIKLLKDVSAQYAGTQGAAKAATAGFVSALVSEANTAVFATDRVEALKAASELLNGTRRGAIDATESFTSSLKGMTLATDTGAVAADAAAAASKAHAEGVTSAKDAVVSAEKSLSDAQVSAKDSQIGITQARKDATQQLNDMKESVKDMANTEEGASISLARARENLVKVNADSKASALDRRQAVLDVSNAENSLKDTQTERVTKTKELANAEKAGINGSPGVIAANSANKDALDAVKAAQDGVKTALDAVTTAQQATSGAADRTTASLNPLTTAGIQNRDMLQDLTKKNEDSYWANLANGDSVEVAKKKYDDQAVAIENTAVKAGFNRREVKRLNAEYGEIPPTKQTDLQTKGFEKVFTDLMVAKVIQDGLDMSKTKSQIDQEVKNQISAVNNPMAYQYRKDLGYGGKAMGGYISGPGSKTSDSIPAWLSDGEFVQPAHAVDHYGEDFMEALRRHQIPKYGFAKGGKAKSWPFVFDMTNTRIPGSTTPDPGVSGGSTPNQAFSTAQAMRASAKVLLALFETGIVESGFKNLASRAVPASLKYPHEGVAAGDHDSVGFLQQRAGWGSVRSRMNVADSTRRFINKAQSREKRYDSAGSLAQAVQVSAYPTRYNAVEGRARKMLGLAREGSSARGRGFPAWPSSAASVHGHDSGVWRTIKSMAEGQGWSGSFGGYNNRRTASGGWSWHASGHAADLGGHNQDKLASWFMAKSPLELIHSTKSRNYGMSRGRPHNMGNTLWNAHKNHIHVAFSKGGPVHMASGGIVKLAPAARKLLRREEEQTVLRAAAGKGLTPRQKEIIRGMSASEVSTLYRTLPRAQYLKVQANFTPAQKQAVATTQTAIYAHKLPGLTRSEEASIIDAVNGGTITSVHKRLLQKLSPREVIALSQHLPPSSINHMRQYLTAPQQAVLDTTVAQKNAAAATRGTVNSAFKAAIQRSASGGSLTKSQKSLLHGLSSTQLAAFRGTMSATRWNRVVADLTPSQRRDVNKRLAVEETQRKNAKPVAPSAPTETQTKLASLEKQLAALSRRPVVNFNGNIGGNVDYAAAFQQAHFWASGM